MDIMTKSNATCTSEPLRSPPFLARSTIDESLILLLGSLEAPISSLTENAPLVENIRHSLNLSALGSDFFAEEVILLLEEQYAAAEEFVYGHPIWKKIRQGDQSSLHAYILETRHYLAAAPSRMCCSVSTGIGLSPLSLMLSKHALEEWDHAKFFNDALALIGCSKDVTRLARPLPSTLEWIHLSRQHASMGELVSVACSGFMEHSSVEKDAVLGWHELLVSSNMLSRSAANKVLNHFSTDIVYGHADHWKKAVRVHNTHSAHLVAMMLNAVCTLSEMIYRWLSSLENGCASAIVTAAQIIAEEKLDCTLDSNDTCVEVEIFDGLPVWPSNILKLINGGQEREISSSTIIVATCYALGKNTNRLTPNESKYGELVDDFYQKLFKTQAHFTNDFAAIDELTTDWLTSIDGHQLWLEMAEGCSDELIIGYMLENFHYLASATRHVSPATAACPDARIRENLLRHLEDELTHCDILKPKLRELGVHHPEKMRALPTTVAFVGYLNDLARHDWQAYIIASMFLQKSLSECRAGERHLNWYAKVSKNNPRCSSLLGAMAAHDEVDDELGHDHTPTENVRWLLARNALNKDSVARAALLPSLAWSFLDGIYCHYSSGQDVVMQRQAWTA